MKSSRKGIELNSDFLLEKKYHEHLVQTLSGKIYFSFMEKHNYLLTHDEKSGLFFFNGKVAEGCYLYARALDESLYGYPVADKEKSNIHHSYFTEGENVLSVGYFHFATSNESSRNYSPGTMLEVSNESGHYTPTDSEMYDEILFYYRMANNRDLIYETHSSIPTDGFVYKYRAADFIQLYNLQPLTPIAKFKNQKSHYGKKLTTSTVEILMKFQQEMREVENNLVTGYNGDNTFTDIPAKESAKASVTIDEILSNDSKIVTKPTNHRSGFFSNYNFCPDEQLLLQSVSLDTDEKFMSDAELLSTDDALTAFSESSDSDIDNSSIGSMSPNMSPMNSHTSTEEKHGFRFLSN